jgi:hypothetical protein
MVETHRTFIGAYAHRFVATDERGRLRLRMAELDRVVGELIAAQLQEWSAYCAALSRDADRAAEAYAAGSNATVATGLLGQAQAWARAAEEAAEWAAHLAGGEA